jgi:hypothetical protein
MNHFRSLPIIAAGTAVVVLTACAPAVLATRDDRLAPFDAVEAFAASNANVTVESFEGGHFDIYQPPVSDWAAQREIEFLTELLADEQGES